MNMSPIKQILIKKAKTFSRLFLQVTLHKSHIFP